MIGILAVRDRDTGEVRELRPMTPEEEAPGGHGKLFAEKRAEYPPPRYELVLGRARSVDEFTEIYPRFKPAR